MGGGIHRSFDLRLHKHSLPFPVNLRVRFSHLARPGVLDTNLCGKVCKLFGRFSPINKSDRHDIR